MRISSLRGQTRSLLTLLMIAAAAGLVTPSAWGAPMDCVSTGATAVDDNGGGACLALGAGATAPNSATVAHTTAIGDGAMATGNLSSSAVRVQVMAVFRDTAASVSGISVRISPQSFLRKSARPRKNHAFS